MNELTVIEPNVPAFSYHDIERIAGAFAQSRMFGVSDPAAALSLCLLAQAEGQHPAIAFRDYSIIQGKPAKKAEAMQRDFMASGGKIKWIELSDTCAKAEFSHPSGGTLTIDWTMERAKAAGIGGKDMWKKYPRQMLRSRTISEGVRSVCPMATSGMYVPEEVADFDRTTEVHIETGEVINANEHIPTNEPPARTKLDGPHASKTALKAAVAKIVRQVEAAESIEVLDAVKAEHKQTINQARRDWIELVEGDPNVEEDIGLKGAFEKRRAELTPAEQSLGFQMLCSVLETCSTRNDLNALLDEHGAVAEALDGEESRKWEELYNAREAAIMAVAPVSAG